MQENNNQSVMLYEEYATILLKAVYDQQLLHIYDFAAKAFAISDQRFAAIKHTADILVKEKLADYSDEERTTITITNFGRYWILKGGYESFLKDMRSSKEHLADEKHHSKEQLLEARLKLTHFRLIGFWLTLIISLVGFILSLFNLYIYLTAKK